MNINLVSTYLCRILLFLTSFPPTFPAAYLSTVPMGGMKHSTNENIEHITDTHAMIHEAKGHKHTVNNGKSKKAQLGVSYSLLIYSHLVYGNQSNPATTFIKSQ